MKRWFSLSDSDYSDDHKPKITNLVAEGYLLSVFTFPPKPVPGEFRINRLICHKYDKKDNKREGRRM